MSEYRERPWSDPGVDDLCVCVQEGKEGNRTNTGQTIRELIRGCIDFFGVLINTP